MMKNYLLLDYLRRVELDMYSSLKANLYYSYQPSLQTAALDTNNSSTIMLCLLVMTFNYCPIGG